MSRWPENSFVGGSAGLPPGNLVEVQIENCFLIIGCFPPFVLQRGALSKITFLLSFPAIITFSWQPLEDEKYRSKIFIYQKRSKVNIKCIFKTMNWADFSFQPTRSAKACQRFLRTFRKQIFSIYHKNSSLPTRYLLT